MARTRIETADNTRVCGGRRTRNRNGCGCGAGRGDGKSPISQINGMVAAVLAIDGDGARATVDHKACAKAYGIGTAVLTAANKNFTPG